MAELLLARRGPGEQVPGSIPELTLAQASGASMKCNSCPTCARSKGFESVTKVRAAHHRLLIGRSLRYTRPAAHGHCGGSTSPAVAEAVPLSSVGRIW